MSQKASEDSEKYDIQLSLKKLRKKDLYKLATSFGEKVYHRDPKRHLVNTCASLWNRGLSKEYPKVAIDVYRIRQEQRRAQKITRARIANAKKIISQYKIGDELDVLIDSEELENGILGSGKFLFIEAKSLVHVEFTGFKPEFEYAKKLYKMPVAGERFTFSIAVTQRGQTPMFRATKLFERGFVLALLLPH